MKYFSCSLVLLFAVTLSGFSQVPQYFDNLNTSLHTYVGQWVHNPSQTGFYQNSLSYSNETNGYVTFTFVGNRFDWYTEKKRTHGIAAISVDNGVETMIDLYSPTEKHEIVYFGLTLSQGTHTVKVRVTGTKHASSTGLYVVHDAFLIYREESTPPSTSNTVYGEGTVTPVANSVNNSAFGYQALSASLGDPTNNNSAFGANALRMFGNVSNHNTAIGSNALGTVIKGGGNTAVGSHAMTNANAAHGNTAVGYEALNQPLDLRSIGITAIGALAGIVPGQPVVPNSTALGYNAKVTAANQVRIGNMDVTSIGGVVSWSTLSDGRFKKDVQEDIAGLEFIKALRPVSYRLDENRVKGYLGIEGQDVDVAAAHAVMQRRTGFIAQEVEKLVAKSGYVFGGVDVPKSPADLYGIRYSEFVVPLVKAVQELSVIVEEQHAQIQEQQLKIEKLLGNFDGTLALSMAGTKTSLLQNTPNPFTEITQIKAVVSEQALYASIIVFNLEGKKVKELPVKGRGEILVPLEGADLTPGMYLYSLVVDGELVDTRKMILSR